MRVLRTVADMQAQSRAWRRNDLRIGLVPTMGYLHEGHLSLVRLSRERADRTVVSLFVNPTQFGPAEDLARYPRDFERDAALCREAGVDVLFAPDAEGMYAENHSTWVVEDRLSQPLCGQSRPGHFRGVATVVVKLLNIVAPDVSVFGQKDGQQAAVVQRVVRDLNMPVEIVLAPTVREADGLAMSSRNTYLSQDERRRALSIHCGLSLAAEQFAAGERDAEALRRVVEQKIRDAGGALEYVELVALETLEPVPRVTVRCMLAVAARFGRTRLIDNALLSP